MKKQTRTIKIDMSVKKVFVDNEEGPCFSCTLWEIGSKKGDTKEEIAKKVMDFKSCDWDGYEVQLWG